MSILIPRSTWGAEHGRGHATGGAKASVTFHHFYRPNVGVVSTAKERETMRSVEDYHGRVLTPSNPRIGYQIVIFQSGNPYEGTGWGRIGAHAAGQNTARVGIAFAIDGDSVTLTPEAVETARRVVQEGRERGFLRQDVYATRHADFSNKSCPGRLVPKSVCDSLLLPPGALGGPVAPRVLKFTEPYQRGADVSDWQKKLVAWRTAAGGRDPITPDGVFGPNTRDESSRFIKTVMSIDTTDPRVGPNTLRAWDTWKKGQTVTTSAHGFTDTHGTNHADAIEKVADAGLMEGFADGTFRPQDALTRGQFAAVLARFLDSQK